MPTPEQDAYMHATFGVNPAEYAPKKKQGADTAAADADEGDLVIDLGVGAGRGDGGHVRGTPVPPARAHPEPADPAAAHKHEPPRHEPHKHEPHKHEPAKHEPHPPAHHPPGAGTMPHPMAADCKIVHGKVPGPINHVLCATHGHVVDTTARVVIAHDIADYIKHFGAKHGGGGGPPVPDDATRGRLKPEHGTD